MADRKISDLTALTTPATGDLLPIVDVSEAAAADKNKSITIQELFKGVPDGTAAAPSLAFAAGTDTGLYSPGNDQVAISTGGNARLYIDASGRVGLGVTSFTAYARADNLVIDGTGHRGITIGSGTSSQSFIAFAPNGATGANTYKGYINYDNSTEALNFGTASTDRVTIDSSGRLLIGQSDTTGIDGEADDLVVSGTSHTGITVRSGSNHNASVYFADQDAVRQGRIEYNHGSNYMRFNTNGSEVVRIDSSGNLGVGTASPQTQFVVSNGGAQGLEVGWDGSTSQFLQAYNRSGSAWIPIRIQGSDIRFNISGSSNEKMRIDSSGRLLVGTTSAGQANADELTLANASGAAGVTIRAAANYNSNVYFGDAGGSDLAGIIEYRHNGDSMRFYTNSTTALTIDSSQRVGIGTSTPSGKLTVNGSVTSSEQQATASSFDLATGNHWFCGAIAVPNPTNQVAGQMCSLRVTAAPTSFASNWKFPGGSYTAPTSFPAVAPFFVQASGTILVGSWTEGIA